MDADSLERLINESIGLLTDKIDRLEKTVNERFDNLKLELRLAQQESDDESDDDQQGEYECRVCRRIESLKYQVECDFCRASVCNDDSCSTELYSNTVCSPCYEAKRKYK